MAFLHLCIFSSILVLFMLSAPHTEAQSTNSPVVLHGGSYQLIHSTPPACLATNRFTSACSCPPSYTPSCFDALVPENTTTDASNSVFSSSNTRVNSSFCVCERINGLSSAAVFGGAYQQDDPTSCTANCRYVNPHTGACTCPDGFQTTSIRTLVFGVGSSGCLASTIGSHILFCIRSANAREVGTYTTDSSAFSLNSQPVSVSVLNNFHGVYAISANYSALQCLHDNLLPSRTSRYLSSINSAGCNCPMSSCGAAFFWLTDELGSPFKNQRVVVCESSMQLAVDASTLKNKTMLGYQKWQATPKNSFNTGWRHWTRDGVDPSLNLVNSAVFDIWPDTSEFPSSNLSSAGLTRPDGSATTLYDAYLEETSQLHFKWLQYYGLDGVWLQRFLSELSYAPLLSARTDALDQVRRYSEQYGRVFGLMWDISGTTDNGTNNNLYNLLQADVTRLRNLSVIFNSSAYVRNNGKPLVTIWGFGVRSEVNVSTAQRCIQLLKGAGFSVMGGVPFSWRTALGANGENFSSVYNAFDMISPWTVGVYNSAQSYLSFVPAIQRDDSVYCEQRGIGYVPVVFPGFSWTNLQNHTGGNVLNQIPRQGGVFLQTQVDSLQSSLVEKQSTSFSHLFIAMFDEFDEGTAIAKAAESSLDKPSQGSFLSYDADGFHVPNDHYLCLANHDTYRLHQPLSINFPYSFRTS